MLVEWEGKWVVGMLVEQLVEKVKSGSTDVWVEEWYGDLENSPRIVWFWDDDGFLKRGFIIKRKGNPILDKIQNIADINKNKVEVFEGEEGERLIKDIEKGEIFTVDDYIKKRGIKSGNLITGIKRIFENLELKGKAVGFEIINEGGYLKIPEKIFVKNKFEKWLEKSFKLNVNEELAKKEIQELWNILTPQQRADLIASIGVPLHNIIADVFNLNLDKVYLLSYGETESGKTFVYQTAEKFFWGVQKFLKGNSFESNFRVDISLASTNLPLLIDDAEPIKEKVAGIIKASTSGGVGFRGTPNQDINIYPARATLLMTSQYNLFEDLFLTDRAAMERRFYINCYNERIDDKKAGKRFLIEMQTSGWIFEYLKRIKAEELKDFLLELYSGNDNGVENSLELGKRVLKELGVDASKEGFIDPGEISEVVIYEEILQDLERMKLGMDSGGGDSEARRLSTLIGLKEEGDSKYIWVTQGYLDYANKNGLLKGKVKKLSELKKLESLFDIKDIYKLPNKTIYSRDNVFYLTNKTVRCATIPFIGDLYSIKSKMAGKLVRLGQEENLDLNNAEIICYNNHGNDIISLYYHLTNITNIPVSYKNSKNCHDIGVYFKNGKVGFSRNFSKTLPFFENQIYDENPILVKLVVRFGLDFWNKNLLNILTHPPFINVPPTTTNFTDMKNEFQNYENINKSFQNYENTNKDIQTKVDTSSTPTQPQPTSPQPQPPTNQLQEPTQQPPTTQSTSPQPYQQNQIPQPSSTQSQPQTTKIEFIRDIPKLVFDKKEVGPCKKGDIIEVEKDLADLFIKKGFAIEFQELTKEIALAIKNALMTMSEFGKDEETFNKVKDHCKREYNLQIKEEWIIKVIDKLEENGNIFLYPPTKKYRWIKFSEDNFDFEVV